MLNIERNLEPTNRDRFTQRITALRNAMKKFVVQQINELRNTNMISARQLNVRRLSRIKISPDSVQGRVATQAAVFCVFRILLSPSIKVKGRKYEATKR